MGTWTKQKGYPVLTLTKEKDGTVYKVVQVTKVLLDSTLGMMGYKLAVVTCNHIVFPWAHCSRITNVKSKFSFKNLFNVLKDVYFLSKIQIVLLFKFSIIGQILIIVPETKTLNVIYI